MFVRPETPRRAKRPKKMLMKEERKKEKVSKQGTNQEGSGERLLVRPLVWFTGC